MLSRLTLLLLTFLSLFFISATTITNTGYPIPKKTAFKEIPVVKSDDYNYKPNFFERAILRFFLKKARVINDNKAENLAKTSLGLGIGAWAVIIMGIAIPFIALASIPLGIGAWITGKQALKLGTSMVGKARLGKGLGLGAVITMIALSLILFILLITLLSTWN